MVYHPCPLCKGPLCYDEVKQINDIWAQVQKLVDHCLTLPVQLDLPLPEPPVPKFPPKKLPDFYFHDDECHCSNCRVTW